VEKDSLREQLQQRMNFELQGLKDAMSEYHLEFEN
jgi:hypothetical protein